LASHSKVRSEIILKPGVKKGFVTELGDSGEEMAVRLTWARLMMRTFKVDVMVCPACGARIRSRQCVSVTELDSIRRILRHLGLQEHSPPVRPARRVYRELEFDQRQEAAMM
jgi:Mn-dependent DtxR family transcriptional regulator